MKKLASLIIVLGLVTLLGCAQLNQPISELNEEYKRAVIKYNQIKPKLDRDFELLFGTKNGEVDTGVNSPQPGIQDVVYDRFDSFDEERQEKLSKANKRAIELYQDYKELTKQVEDRGLQVGESLQKLEELTSQKEVNQEGLKLLREFIAVAGKVAVSS